MVLERRARQCVEHQIRSGRWKCAVGLADLLVDALAAQALKGITLIANNAGGDFGGMPRLIARGAR